jgi:hypothetical protein
MVLSEKVRRPLAIVASRGSRDLTDNVSYCLFGFMFRFKLLCVKLDEERQQDEIWVYSCSAGIVFISLGRLYQFKLGDG